MNSKKMITGSLIILGMGLGACHKNSSAHAYYKCEGNVTLDVVFTNGNQVQIGIADRAYKLDRVEEESAAKYESGPISFISKGADAQFQDKSSSKPAKCHRE